MVRALGQDDRLAARDRARAEDARGCRRAQGVQARDLAPPPRQGAATDSAARRERRPGGAGPARPRSVAGASRCCGNRPGRTRARTHRAHRARGGPARCARCDSRRNSPAGRRMRVAYYKGCLASLSAKELDSSTQALAPKLGIELDELESVTCCGAGDIHEAEPDYYLHLNARILAYAEATGADTLMTICNVCTLNLRQANHQLQRDDALR